MTAAMKIEAAAPALTVRVKRLAHGAGLDLPRYERRLPPAATCVRR